jgi:hypothetical protein
MTGNIRFTIVPEESGFKIVAQYEREEIVLERL